jgi:hypothetical protein
MNPFDQASRFTAKRLDLAGFARWLLGGAPLVFHRLHDTASAPLPGDEDRRCDTVLLFQDPARPGVVVALIVEFQTENDPEILERLLEYAAQLRRELRRQGVEVIAAVLNLTGPPQGGVLEMLLPGRPEVGLRFGVLVRTLREEDAGATLAEIAAGRTSRCVLPWIPLMRGAGEAGMIEEWKRLAAAEPDRGFRGDYAHLARTFAGLTDHEEAWKQALEGWDMRESTYLKEVESKIRERVLSEMSAKRLEKARAQLIQTLPLRYQTPVPPDLAAAIDAASDLEELDRWFDAVFTAPTLDAYRAAIGR